IAVSSAYTVYHPQLTSLIQQQSVTSTPTNQTSLASGGAGPVSKTTTYNGGITQSIRKTGATLSLTLNNQHNTTTTASPTCNPCYNPLWTANVTQPLFRNFKIDANRQTLAVALITRDISDVQLQATITNTVSNVRNAYWDYVYAQGAVDVAQQSLDI